MHKLNTVQQEEQPEQDTSVETEDYSSYEEEKEEAVQDEIQVAPEQISNIIDAEIEEAPMTFEK